MQRLRAQLAHLNARMAASAMGVAVAFGGVKNGLADLIIQHAVEQRPLGQTDWKRLNVFVTFGLLYVGGVQFILFNRLMPRMFKGLLEGRRAAAVKATIFDQVQRSVPRTVQQALSLSSPRAGTSVCSVLLVGSAHAVWLLARLLCDA